MPEVRRRMVSHERMLQCFDEMVEARIAKRDRCSRLGNSAGVDAIERELKAYGVVLEDVPSGVSWRIEGVDHA